MLRSEAIEIICNIHRFCEDQLMQSEIKFMNKIVFCRGFERITKYQQEKLFDIWDKYCR